MAKQFFGISAYAGMHKNFPAKRFMDQFPDNAKTGCIAILSGSFGWSTKLIRLFVDRFPAGLIEVHMGNGAGRRRYSQEVGEFAKKYSVDAYNVALEKGDKAIPTLVEARLLKIKTLIFDMAPTCKWVLSPELEDNLTDKAFSALVKIIKSFMPDITLARSPCSKGKALDGAKFYERHGINYYGKPGEILNMDGVSLNARDGSKFFQQASYETVKRMLDSSQATANFIWSARQQGYPNLSGWGKTPPKRSRTFEVTDQEIALMRRLLNGR